MCSRILPPKVTSPPFHPGGGGEGTVTRRLGEFALLVLHSLLQNSKMTRVSGPIAESIITKQYKTNI